MVSKTLFVSAIFGLVGLVAIQQVTSTTNEKDENYLHWPFGHKPHNLDVGDLVDGASVLDVKPIELERNHFGWVSYDYLYPTSTANNKDIFITRVVVADLLPNGQGGYPVVKSGGPGSSNVHIHIESRWNKGIKSIVTVYGFPKQVPTTTTPIPNEYASNE